VSCNRKSNCRVYLKSTGFISPKCRPLLRPPVVDCCFSDDFIAVEGNPAYVLFDTNSDGLLLHLAPACVADGIIFEYEIVGIFADSNSRRFLADGVVLDDAAGYGNIIGLLKTYTVAVVVVDRAANAGRYIQGRRLS